MSTHHEGAAVGMVTPAQGNGMRQILEGLKLEIVI